MSAPAGSRARALRKLGPALLILIWPIAAGWLCWQLTRLAVRAVGLLTGVLAVALPPLIVGRHRRAGAPLWVWLGALISLGVPAAAWIWLSAAAALMYLGTRQDREVGGVEVHDITTAAQPDPEGTGDRDEDRKYLSAREMRIAGRVFAGIALATGLGAPWWAAVAVITLTVLGGAITWWKDFSPAPVALSAFEEDWYAKVANPHPEVDSRYPELEGWFREWDDEAGRGIYELASSDAWAVAGMDAKVELAFDQRPGTISLAADPRLSRRLLRITASAPSVGGRMKYFDGHTLQRDGSFIAGYNKGGVPVYGKLWNRDGALYITIIAPPNMGKGSLLRLICVEGAAYPDMEMFGACGKLGAGIGYLREGFHTLTTDHDASVDLIHGYLLAVRERKARYGAAEEDGFMVRHLDPRLMLVVDEPEWIMEHDPRVAGWFREITGTSRSVGAGLAFTLHKGDGPSYGDTKTRSNMITNGWRGMGPAPDNQAKSTGLQGDDFDPATLPNQPGWFGLIGRPLDAPATPFRTLWLPNNLDVARALDEDVTGLVTDLDAAPYGTVQQWLERDTVHPDIHPDTLEALLRPAKQRAEAIARAEQLAEQTTGQPDGQLPGQEPADVGAAPADGWSRIEAALRQNPEGLLRFQIAKAANLSGGHTSELLRVRSEKHGDVVQNKNKTWRLAA